MKYLKVLGLAALAAMALAAFSGAGIASATVLCGTSKSPCNSIYPAGTQVTFSLEQGQRLQLTTNGSVETSCGSAEVSGESTTQGSQLEKVKGKFSSFSMSSCYGIPGTCEGTPTFSGENLPWAADFRMSVFGGEARIYSPKIGMTCKQPIVGTTLTCHYTASEIHIYIAEGEAVGKAWLDSDLGATESGGPCGTAAHISANMRIASPTPLYVRNS